MRADLMISVWKSPPPSLKLSLDYVDVWQVTLSAPHQIEKYRVLLTQEELERCERFKSEKRRREFIIGRGLLRILIGQCLDIDPTTFDFAYTEHQKPYLPAASLGVQVNFNVTHSHNLALIALTLERMIGVDIEYIRHNVEFRKLARRFFSNQESSALSAYDDPLLPAAFFACWTRKEAFVKALGDGIAFGLGDFTVSVDPRDQEVALKTAQNTNESDNWSIINLDIGRDYAAAVAANGGRFKLRLWNSSPDLL